MNRTYKSVYNESTGTFVAVAENVKAKGKRSSSRVKTAMAGLAAAVAAGALVAGSAFADVVINESGNTITFTDSAGTINFSNGGSITGLTSLMVDSVHAGNTTMNDSGLVIVGDPNGPVSVTNSGLKIGATGPSITGAGISAGNKIISNVADGVGNGDAANMKQLNEVKNTAGKGWKLAAVDTADSEQIEPDDTVTFDAGQNLEVERDGAKITYKTADEVTFDKVHINNGPSFSNTGIDMSNQKITNLGVGTLADGSTDAVTGGQVYGLFLGSDKGVRYFHAKSGEPDSEAVGKESIAIGPNTVSGGDSSFAAGDGAITTDDAVASIALGKGANAGTDQANDGEAAIAIGRGAQASGKNTIAMGDGAKVDSQYVTGSQAIGLGAKVTGQDSHNAIAFGSSAEASAGNATALGADAKASGANSIALGGATAFGNRTVAAGLGAFAGTKDSVVLGTGAGVGTGSEILDPEQRHSLIAIGKDAGKNIDGNQAIAIGVGAGASTKKSEQIAIGTLAGTNLEGERNVSLGFEANKYDARQEIRHATALGGMTQAMTDAVAVGYAATATTNSVALGAGAKAEDESIALGHNSYAKQVAGESYLTGKSFTGSSVSVGNDTLTRRITNVEDGAEGNDAINVNQLKALKESLGSFTPGSGGNVNYNVGGTISVAAGTVAGEAVNVGQMDAAIAAKKTKFYSVNPNGSTANENGDGALGANSANSMAIGHAAAISSAERATAVGYSVLVKAADGTALGSGSTVDDKAGVAIGHKAYSRGENSLAIGTDAETEAKAAGLTVDNAIAIGTSSRSTSDSASAIGHHATASSEKSAALGYMANATGGSALAFGDTSSASGTNAQASGTRSTATRENAQASGTDSKAYAKESIAIGTGATSGEATPLPGDDEGNRATIAIGQNARAVKENAFASGTGAEASAINAMASGTLSKATAENAIATGHKAEALFENSVALGAGAKAQNARAVALGDGAETAVAVGTAGFTTADNENYAYAGIKPIATVSVGKEGEERTITHVAAGRVSALSTDAINGSQLYQTQTAMGESVATVLGGGSKYDPDTFTVTADLNVRDDQSNFDNVEDALQYVGQGWDVSAQGGAVENVAPGGKVDFSNTDGNIEIARDGTDLTFDLNKDLVLGGGDESGSLTVEDEDGNTTTTTGQGTTVTDGTATTTVGAGTVSVGGGEHTVVINGGTGTIGGLTNTTFDADYVITSGQAATEDQLKLVSQVAGLGWNIDSSGTEEVSNVAPGAQVDFLGDSNITIDHEQDDDGNVDVQVRLKKELDLTEEGSLTVGHSFIDNDGLTVNDGAATTEVVAGLVSVGGSDNKIIINGGTGTIGGLTNTTFDADYVITSGQAATEDQLKLVSEVAGSGWYVSVEDGAGENVAPGDKVDFSSKDKNLTLTQEDITEGVDDDDNPIVVGQAIDLALADTLKIGSDEENQVIIGDAGRGEDEDGNPLPGITVPGGEGGDRNVVIGGGDVAIHIPGLEDGPLYVGETLMTGLNFAGNNYDEDNGGPVVNKKFGERLDILGEGWIESEVRDGAIYIKLRNDFPVIPTPGGENGGDPGGGNGDEPGDDGLAGGNIVAGGDIEGGKNINVKPSDDPEKPYTVVVETTPDVDHNSVTVGDVVINQGGINAGNKNITNVAAGVDDTDAVNVGQLEGGLDKLDKDLTNKGLNFSDDQGDVVHRDLGQTLGIVGANKNITTKVNAGTGSVEIALSDDLDLDSVTINNGGPIINKDGINMTDNQITNVADGKDRGDAVNKGQLDDGLDDLDKELTTKGLNFADSQGDVVHRDLGETLDVVGANDNVTTKVNAQKGILEIALSDDLNVESVTINNGGPIINENGINMNDNRVTNVAAGIDGSDAVNVDQLETVRGNLQGQVSNLRHDIRRMDKKLSAGVAAAMATAALPQAYLPGKNMMAMSGGTWNGESGMAIGYSGISDNGSWVYKLSGNATSRGDYGGAVGIGYQW